MRVGTMFLGKVDSLYDESIQTKFFIFGVPLIPLQSYYCTSESLRGVEGYKIDLHFKSVVCGYGRLISMMGAVAGFIFGKINDDRSAYYWGIASLALFGLSYIWGLISGKEKTERIICESVVGSLTPPKYLPLNVRLEIKEKLIRDWETIKEKDELTESEALEYEFCMARFSNDDARSNELLSQINR